MAKNTNIVPQGDRSDEPLYNSMLLRNYIYYVSEFFTSIDINSTLKDMGISKLEIEDQGHWFSQNQVDKFYKILIEKTGNSRIAREVGRYASSPKVFNTLSQYFLGFLTPSNAYRMIEKSASNLLRGYVFQTRKLAKNQWEIVVKPEPGIIEKPYQCQNRIGMFEAVAKLFTGEYASIEHPLCLHDGDNTCTYIISWKNNLSLKWRIFRNYALLFSSLLSIVLFFFLPLFYWLILIMAFGLFSSSIFIYSQNLRLSELAKTVETQGDAANELLREMNTRHENALLIQEIGQATSTVLDIHMLFNAVTSVMEKRLDFDRGMIMIPNYNKTSLYYVSGYGYEKEYEDLLQKTSFSLQNPNSKGMAVLAFRQQEPFLINDISIIEDTLSEKSIEFVKRIGAQSFICVPIVYKRESLGILAVDNINSKKPFTQSDINLLMGVASLTAVSIINAKSYNKLQESEKKYRELVETANSIILRMDLTGKITFFNNFAQKFFGYSEVEIIGMNVKETILPKEDIEKDAVERLVKILRKDPEKRFVEKDKVVIRNGEHKWITWTFNPIFDSNGSMKEILCIGNDITALEISRQEKEKLEVQLQASQKMEAVGTLAGGIAHDFNNILQAILSNIQVLMISKELDDAQKSTILSAVERSVERASDLTKRLLLFSRKVDSDLRPLDIREELEHIVKMLERTIPKMITIELKVADNLKFINGDPSQIEQILMNLAINSRDAMPEGGVLSFSLENTKIDETFSKKHLGLKPGEYVLMTVADTGHGIDLETQKHIFEPFFTTKEVDKGTGLGLATVYGIIKNHRGYISCRSSLGNGCTFKLYFPSLDDKYIIDNKIEDEQVMGGDETILLVDDEEGLREPMEILLKSHGYNPISAMSGEQALSIYEKKYQTIDLVLLDLIMPGMGGEKCLDGLIKINDKAKVIMISGYSDITPGDETVERYAKDFIIKPYESKHLLKIIRNVLDEK